MCWDKCIFRWNYIRDLKEQVKACEEINALMAESYDDGLVLHLDIMYSGFFKFIVLHEMKYTEMYIGFISGGRVQSIISLCELA